MTLPKRFFGVGGGGLLGGVFAFDSDLWVPAALDSASFL